MNVVRRRAPVEAESPLNDPSSSEPPSPSPQGTKSAPKKERINWWMWLTGSIAFWKRRSQIIASKASPVVPKSKTKDNSKKSSEDSSVLLPPDLPVEEIAREVVRLKGMTDKAEEERMYLLYAEAVERSDRKWIMLLCFLIALSIGMLSIVALRIGPL